LTAAPFVVQDACVELEGARVLDDVNLTIATGEYVVMLGENGSGKTTLLRAMLGLVPLSSGSIDVHGQPSTAFDQWARLAYVPQRLLAASTVPVSVIEVVMAARIRPTSRLRPRRHEAREASLVALESMGLAHRANDRFDSLSGGQQRRVMVARALAAGADTLLLDEPTAGVDADSELKLADALADLHAQGRTIVLVTHDLGEVSEPADHIVVLGGRGTNSVIYDGPPPPPKSLIDHVWHHGDDHDVHRTPNEPTSGLRGSL
jgi:zinc transport system ATP-binding protein